MGEYEKYIAKLKAVKAPFDEDRMDQQLARQIRHSFSVPKLALGAALAVFLFGLYGYWLGSASLFDKDETLSGYIFQSGNLNGDPVMNYVFVD